VELLELLLEQSRRDLDLRVKIIEEETKKAGLILAAIGVILGVLLNIFLITQKIVTDNSTSQDSSGISPAVIKIINGFFSYELIFAEVLLLLLAAICLVGMLIIIVYRKEQLPVINYLDWMDETKPRKSLEDLQNTLISNNKKAIVCLDKKN